MLSDQIIAKKRRTPKRKSCIECIQAKRRCDPGSTACVRCSKQKLQCQYVPHLRAVDDAELDEDSSRLHESNIVFNLPQLSTMQDSGGLGALERTFNPVQSSFNDFQSLENLPWPNHDLMSFNFSSPQTSSTALQHIPNDSNIGEWSNLSSSKLPSFAASRLNYGIAQFKLAPSMMVHQNKTFWTHPLLYENHIPRTMHGIAGSHPTFQISHADIA
jgi:hypothetical protein